MTIDTFILTAIADSRSIAEAMEDDPPAVCIAAEMLLDALRRAVAENDELRRRLAAAGGER